MGFDARRDDDPCHEGAVDTIHGGNQGYDIEISDNEKLATPRWPNVDLTTILRTAFKGRVIDHVDHQVIARSMRGRI